MGRDTSSYILYRKNEKERFWVHEIQAKLQEQCLHRKLHLLSAFAYQIAICNKMEAK